MKKKLSIIILVHLGFITFILLNRNLLVKDIFELYLLMFLSSFILSSAVYLLKRETSYFQFIKNELFNGAINLLKINNPEIKDNRLYPIIAAIIQIWGILA